ncbi:MAG: response regulator, partial [Anaerolineales bacterium]
MSYTVLMVEDEVDFIEVVKPYIEARGYEVIIAPNLTDARTKIKQGIGDILLLDIYLPDGNGLTLFNETINMNIPPSVIVVTGNGDIETAVEAMKSGATDFLPKPVNFIQLDKTLQRAADNVSLRRELAFYRQAQLQNIDFIIGKSPLMRRL